LHDGITEFRLSVCANRLPAKAAPIEGVKDISLTSIIPVFLGKLIGNIPIASTSSETKPFITRRGRIHRQRPNLP
jgi:hypothetical protein